MRKGQRLDLAKEIKLKNIIVGLGWDVRKEKKFFSIDKGNINCDISTILPKSNKLNSNSVLFILEV